MTLIHTQQGMHRLHLAQLRTAIKLYAASGIRVSRTAGISNLLAATTRQTGKCYPRSPAGYAAAQADLQKLLDDAS